MIYSLLTYITIFITFVFIFLFIKGYWLQTSHFVAKIFHNSDLQKLIFYYFFYGKKYNIFVFYLVFQIFLLNLFIWLNLFFWFYSEKIYSTLTYQQIYLSNKSSFFISTSVSLLLWLAYSIYLYIDWKKIKNKRKEKIDCSSILKSQKEKSNYDLAFIDIKCRNGFVKKRWNYILKKSHKLIAKHELNDVYVIVKLLIVFSYFILWIKNLKRNQNNLNLKIYYQYEEITLLKFKHIIYLSLTNSYAI